MAKSAKKAPKKAVVKKIVVKKNFFRKVGDSVIGFFKKLFSKIKISKAVLSKLLIVLVFILSFVLIDFFVQYLNNGYSSAIVNGVRIPRSEYVNRLEKAYGVTAINRLVEEQLIEQGAKAKGVTVTDEEVQTRVTQYYDENGGKDTVLTALSANGLTEDDLVEQIKLAILQEKALTGDIKYDDKTLEKFFNDYKTDIYGDTKVTFAEKKAEITQYYISYQVQQMAPTWIADLQKAAKIQNNVATKPAYGVLKTTVNIVKNLYNSVMSKIKK
jgi:foldase protein PrsA